MNKLNLLMSFICLFTCLSCKQEGLVIFSNQEEILFNVSETFDLDTVIHSIKYVPLGMDSENSLFRDAHKVLIHNHKIFVLDIISKYLLVFDEEGNFITKVGSVGQGPGEFIMISDFDIDLLGNIYIYNGPKKELLIFNEQYVFIRSLKLPFDIDNFAVLCEGKFLFALAKYNEGKCKGYRVAISDTLFNVEYQGIKYNEDNYDDNYVLETFMQKTTEGVIYYKPIDDYAYLFSEKGLQKEIKFDMGKMRVPDKLRKNVQKLKSEFAQLYEFVITTPIFVRDYVIGIMVKKNNLSFFMYNKKNKKIFEKQSSMIIPAAYVDEFSFLSIINEVIYPGYDSDENLTLEQKEHIAKGGTILCIYTLL